jgi:AbrB family looped-hinge helix DNA binding protein
MNRKLMNIKDVKNGVEYTRYRVTVPVKIVDALGWHAGDKLELKIRKDGELLLRKI